MNVGAVGHVATASTLLPNSKSFSLLLELGQTFSEGKIRVKLSDTSQITLSIKEPMKIPMEAGQLYHAIIEKEENSYLLKELFALPSNTKALLTQKAQIDLHRLIARLSQGVSPQKLLFETLAAELLQTHDKEGVRQQLDQLIHLLTHKEPTITFEYRGSNGYITFKRKKSEFSQKKVEFEAFFSTIGPLNGTLFLNGTIKEARLEVSSAFAAAVLEAEKEYLPMKLYVTVAKKMRLQPQTSLLDLKV